MGERSGEPEKYSREIDRLKYTRAKFADTCVHSEAFGCSMLYMTRMEKADNGNEHPKKMRLSKINELTG
jgi:hypothetical protein